jgi:hypothetical protein
VSLPYTLFTRGKALPHIDIQFYHILRFPGFPHRHHITPKLQGKLCVAELKYKPTNNSERERERERYLLDAKNEVNKCTRGNGCSDGTRVWWWDTGFEIFLCRTAQELEQFAAWKWLETMCFFFVFFAGLQCNEE